MDFVVVSADEENLRRVLSDPQRRAIAEFCAQPHSSDEIFKHLKITWSIYSRDSLASDIKALEDIKGIVYSEDKWATTEPTKKVLRKYFGLS